MKGAFVSSRCMWFVTLLLCFLDKCSMMINLHVCILQRNGHATVSSDNNECEIENIHLERVGNFMGIHFCVSIM